MHCTLQLDMHALDEGGFATACGSQHDEVAAPFLLHLEVVHCVFVLALATCPLSAPPHVIRNREA